MAFKHRSSMSSQVEKRNNLNKSVKSSEHFRASFSKVSNNILVAESDGALNPNFKEIKYEYKKT